MIPLPGTVGLPVRAGRCVRAENGALCLVLVSMAAIPAAELVLRAATRHGIYGAASIVQHLGLVLGMLGCAVAARERRLLTMSALGAVLDGRAQRVASALANGVGAAICAVLAAATATFVASEREAAGMLAYGIPVWWVEALMPAGFALIGWRLWTRVARTIAGRFAGLLLGAALGAIALNQPALPGAASIVLPLLLGAAALAGMPVFAVLAGAAITLFWSAGVPLAAIALDQYRTVVNPSLPAIPLFTVAGYLLAESSAPRRLIELFDALFGRLRGGAAIVTVLGCTFFTSFTGASGATVLALGGMVMPLLLARGYPQRRALGLVTAAGLPGTLVMPALPMILYAIIAGTSISDMFLAGIVPSALMAAVLVGWGMRHEPRVLAPPPFDPARTWRAVRGAGWELAVPVVPIVALSSGLATAVESAALTAIYAFCVTTLVRRDIPFGARLVRVLTECGLVVGGILLIMGVALGVTDYLVDAEVPRHMVDWATATIHGRLAFLAALNLALLAAGCLIEIYPAILVLVPLITPLGAAYGIAPLHLGVIFLSNMELGYLTPLVGLNLFFASYRFDKPIAELFRAVLPLFVVLAAGVVAITYVPALSLALPEAMHSSPAIRTAAQETPR